jgi:arginase
MPVKSSVQVITAASILGLKPTGVEQLASTLLAKGLISKIGAAETIVEVPTINHLYDAHRPAESILNLLPLKQFSLSLSNTIQRHVSNENFLLVLGGDCSILIGVMLGLKRKGTYGLFFIDGHADFYSAETSLTGEAADMDLALVTGRGPSVLTNLHDAGPYVRDENIVHFGQRDIDETLHYQSPDIRDTSIECFDEISIRRQGVQATIQALEKKFYGVDIDGFWIHFDTDVIEDGSNSAVDYRLPGGLSIQECQQILSHLILTYNVVGMTVSIYNPKLDHDGKVAGTLVDLLAEVLH